MQRAGRWQMSRSAQGHLAMLAFSVLVAGSFSLGALAANEIAPAALNAARFALAGVLIGAVVIVRGGIAREALRAPWRYVVLGGFFAAYFVLMFEGLKTAPSVNAAAVFTLTPVLVAMFGWILLRQVTTGRMAAALTIGGSGALWVIFQADPARLAAFEIGRGELVYFCGCACHAVYTPLSRKLNRGEPPVVFTFGILVAGAVLLTIFGWRDVVGTDWGMLPPVVWVTLVYVAVFASAATFVLLLFAAMRLPSAKVMAYTYLVPSWVLLWEGALGNRLPPPIILGGVAMTAMALWLLLRDET